MFVCVCDASPHEWCALLIADPEAITSMLQEKAAFIYGQLQVISKRAGELRLAVRVMDCVYIISFF